PGSSCHRTVLSASLMPFFLLLTRPPASPLFPYTTLFRSAVEAIEGQKVAFEPAAIPAVVFTDPEIAWAGLTENEAKAQGRKVEIDRKSTRLNSSHVKISYAVFCLKKKRTEGRASGTRRR